MLRHHPFTLSGAMAPATVVGAIAQQHAEALAGIAFYQMIRAGAPCAYGGFTSNVDMKSGAPAFGTPEYFRSTVIGGPARPPLAPYRGSNVNAANSVDARRRPTDRCSAFGPASPAGPTSSSMRPAGSGAGWSAAWRRRCSMPT
ncbi:MAG: trimethylamine methyltransferase family protein [Geminicoccaceae bacterium]